LLSEACIAWNVRHPENKASLGPECEWPLLVNATYSFIRHSFTSYDQEVSAETREELRNRIAAEARKVYPWLALTEDPRNFSPDGSVDRKPEKYFNQLSKCSAALVTKRSQLVQALYKARGEERARLQAMLVELDADCEYAQRQFKTVAQKFGDGLGFNKDTRLEIFDRENRNNQDNQGYWYLGRKLFSCHLKDLGFKCPKCSARVLQTKRETDLGAGIKLFITSCHCMTVATSRDWRRQNLEIWTYTLPGAEEEEDD
jgi:hypothetical protein